MVESFLYAHRGQMPVAAFQKRVDEWTPEVSAGGWARVLAQSADGNSDRDVVLVAEDDQGILGLVSGGAAQGGVDDTTGEVGALYVHPRRHGQGVGRALLRAAARHLADLGYTELQIGVLSANRPARAFYEAMGGREIGQGTDDEEGYLLPLTSTGGQTSPISRPTTSTPSNRATIRARMTPCPPSIQPRPSDCGHHGGGCD